MSKSGIQVVFFGLGDEVGVVMTLLSCHQGDVSSHIKSRYKQATQSLAMFVCSLAQLTLLTRAAALRFATLASLTHSVHGLARSLCSLPHGTVEILEYVFTL